MKLKINLMFDNILILYAITESNIKYINNIIRHVKSNKNSFFFLLLSYLIF